MFDKQALLGAYLPKVVPVEFAFEGTTTQCYVRELSARQVFELQDRRKNMKEDKANREFTIELLKDCLCDPEGKTIYTREDIETLFASKVQAFNSLSRLVAKTVGLMPEEEKEEGKA